MNRGTSIAMMTIAGIICGMPARSPAGDESALLRDVHYNVQQGISRLTLCIDGGIRYSAVKQENRIVFGFPHTRVGSPPGAARLGFTSGLISGVTIDRVKTDSTRVVVTLRDQTTYRVVQPISGSELLVDVMVDTGAVAAAVKPMRTGPPRAMTQPPKPNPRAGLVDIPSIARTQVQEGENTSRGRREVQAPSPAAPPVAEQQGPAILSLVLVGALAFAGVFGTAILLVVASRKSRTATVKTTTASDAAGRRPAFPTDVIPAASREESPGAFPEEVEEEPPMLDDRALHYARQFRRGHDELEFASRIEELPSGRAIPEVVNRLRATKASPARRISAARKLGVGCGELELAIHLKEVELKASRKEGGE